MLFFSVKALDIVTGAKLVLYFSLRLFVLQDDMNLTAEKKAPLRERDLSFKRQMLVMHYKAPSKVRFPLVSNTDPKFIVSNRTFDDDNTNHH